MRPASRWRRSHDHRIRRRGENAPESAAVEERRPSHGPAPGDRGICARGLAGSGTEPSPGPAATEQVDERELMIELRSPRTERFADVAEWRISWQMRNKQLLIWDFSAETEGFEPRAHVQSGWRLDVLALNRRGSRPCSRRFRDTRGFSVVRRFFARRWGRL